MTQEEALNTLMKMRAWRAWGKEQKEEERPEMPEQKEVDEAFDVCIELLQQPPLSSNLDEAAIQAHIRLEDGEGLSFLNIFKAGAEWMAGQGCTVEIDEGYFINNPQHDRRKGKFHKYYSSTFGHSKKNRSNTRRQGCSPD